VAPGPQVGAILQAVEDARLEGRVRTRDEALALIDALAASGGASGGGKAT